MSNPSKQKGSSFEVSLLPALRSYWPNAERLALQGSRDRGDFSGCGRFVIEAKNEKKVDLAGYLKEAQVEALNAGGAIGVAIIKRRGITDPMRQYVLMDLATLLRIFQEDWT